ncbi:MAG TPA: 5-(carboxyamino)imidazole ribonucleotide synthase [Bacteroidia bacterium]|nr:5-(carboxyamino)imidazole ribonucleotide synthase [Bacteroidia bacterium]
MVVKLDTRIGIIGGGQLGKMLIEAAQPLNFYCTILESDENAPASRIADVQLIGKLTEARGIRELAKMSDVLTYEIEHVDVDTLLALEKDGVKIIPSPQILSIIKDKGLQKQFYKSYNIPTAPFLLVDSPAEWKDALTTSGFKRFAAKLRQGGYDGKGVALCNTISILSGEEPVPFDAPCMLEEFVECEKELSVMVARDEQGNTTTWPVVEMDFDPQANLVEFLASPARINDSITEEARKIALLTIEKLNGVGVFAVEMFLDKKGQVLVNEVAPRPHNSGHHTIEANYTSQYEQLVRILTGLPLGNTGMIKPAVMLNLLGNGTFRGKFTLQGMDTVLKMPGVYIHLYNKKKCRPMRKMGHVTVLGDTLEEAIEKATFVKNTLTFIPVGNE